MALEHNDHFHRQVREVVLATALDRHCTQYDEEAGEAEENRVREQAQEMGLESMVGIGKRALGTQRGSVVDIVRAQVIQLESMSASSKVVQVNWLGNMQDA